METSTARPSTLGEILQFEFLEPMRITPETLSEETGIDIGRIRQLIVNKCYLSNSETTKLALFFDTDANFWGNIQESYKKWVAKRA